MKIALITREFGYRSGGLAYGCAQFVELLKEMGHEAEIFLLNPNPESDDGTDVTVIVPIVFPGGYNPNLQHQIRLRHLQLEITHRLTKGSFDLVVGFGGGFNGYFASLLAASAGLPFFLLLRGSDLNLADFDLSSYIWNKEALARTKVVVGLSQELINRAKSIYTDEKTTYLVIPNHHDLPDNVSKVWYNHKKMVVFGLAAKNINEKKGVANLLNALYHLTRIDPTVKFTLDLVGDIDKDLYASYIKYIDDANLRGLINFYGSLTREKLHTVMSGWDFSIQTSVCEGYSNFIAESFSLGVPAIISNTGFFAESLCDVTHELVFDSLNPKSIAEKLYSVLFQHDLSKLTVKALDTVRPLVSKAHVINQWKTALGRGGGFKEQNLIFPQRHFSVQAIVFHDISSELYSPMDIPCEEFSRLIQRYYEQGYILCSARDYLADRANPRRIICTFDDGYEGVFRHALPVFTKLGFSATVFVNSSLIGLSNNWNPRDKLNRKHMCSDMLTSLVDSGWEIGSHGADHISLLRLSSADVIESLASSRKHLSCYGQIIAFAYPYGDYSEHVRKFVQQHYEVAFASEQGGTHFDLDRFSIKRYSPQELINFI